MDVLWTKNFYAKQKTTILRQVEPHETAKKSKEKTQKWQTHDLIDLRHTSIEGRIKDPCLKDSNKKTDGSSRFGSQEGSFYPEIVFNFQWYLYFCFIEQYNWAKKNFLLTIFFVMFFPSMVATKK